MNDYLEKKTLYEFSRKRSTCSKILALRALMMRAGSKLFLPKPSRCAGTAALGVSLLLTKVKIAQSHRLPMMPTDERAIIPMHLVHRAGEHREWNRQLPAPTPTPPPVPPVPAIG